jgi:flagellar hook-basal body complex protein FliE
MQVHDDDDDSDDGGIFDKPLKTTKDKKYAAIFDTEINGFSLTEEEDRLRQLLLTKDKVIGDLYRQISESGDFGKLDHLKHQVSNLEAKLHEESKQRHSENAGFSDQLHKMATQLQEFQSKVETMEKVFKSNKINTTTGQTEIEVGGGMRKLNIGDDNGE